MFGRTKAEIFEDDDVIHHMLQALRMLHARDVIQAVPMLLRMERMLSNFLHGDGRKTIQIRNVWTRFF